MSPLQDNLQEPFCIERNLGGTADFKELVPVVGGFFLLTERIA